MLKSSHFTAGLYIKSIQFITMNTVKYTTKKYLLNLGE